MRAVDGGPAAAAAGGGAGIGARGTGVGACGAGGGRGGGVCEGGVWAVEVFEDVCETGLVEVDVCWGGVFGLFAVRRVSCECKIWVIPRMRHTIVKFLLCSSFASSLIVDMKRVPAEEDAVLISGDKRRKSRGSAADHF